MKNLLKILCFGAVFNGGDLAARGSVIYYDRRIAELSNEQEGQIDVLCVGDSLCAAGFCSPTLYRDYGITSYNMGKEMQKPVETYCCIKEAIRHTAASKRQLRNSRSRSYFLRRMDL